MIDEKRIEELRGHPELAGACLNEILDTLAALWPIARAARRWLKASPGLEAVEREAVLNKLLEDLKG